MSTKNTPGPWRAEPGAFAFSFRIYGKNGEPVADTCDVAGAKENAALLAAAPMLADALEGLLAHRYDGEMPREPWLAAEAALRAAGRL